MIIILMGVAGAGKTTIGQRLAAVLGWRFEDGDAFHPQANIDKMKSGLPLTDADRSRWLERLRQLIARLLAQNEPAVIACSALKQTYRDYLQLDARQMRFVYLRGNYELILRRLQRRKGHFMKPELLKSQFEALEEPEGVLSVDIDQDPAAIVALIQRALGLAP